MRLSSRLLVAAAFIWFVWCGSKAAIEWPIAGSSKPAVTRPDTTTASWVREVGKVAKTMLYTDRIYCANMYDAMRHVIAQDGNREKPIIADTDRLAVFHGGTLDFAVDAKKVGEYPGLAEAIDLAFVKALGADVRPLDAAARADAEKLCAALSYVFAVGGNE